MGELPPIVIEIKTPASPDEAWLALTDPERVVLWFTDASPVGHGTPGLNHKLRYSKEPERSYSPLTGSSRC